MDMWQYDHEDKHGMAMMIVDGKRIRFASKWEHVASLTLEQAELLQGILSQLHQDRFDRFKDALAEMIEKITPGER